MDKIWMTAAGVYVPVADLSVVSQEDRMCLSCCQVVCLFMGVLPVQKQLRMSALVARPRRFFLVIFLQDDDATWWIPMPNLTETTSDYAAFNAWSDAAWGDKETCEYG